MVAHYSKWKTRPEHSPQAYRKSRNGQMDLFDRDTDTIYPAEDYGKQGTNDVDPNISKMAKDHSPYG